MKNQYKQIKSTNSSEFYLNTYSWDSEVLCEKSERQLQSKKRKTLQLRFQQTVIRYTVLYIKVQNLVMLNELCSQITKSSTCN